MDTTRINKLITDAMESGMFPGGAISIGDKNGELFRNHYGKRALYPEVLPLDESTLFDLASLTKIISTTMVALVLIEAGKLSLDDTLDKFFDTPVDKKHINIHHLMTHTSGLPAHEPLYELLKSPEDVYAKILEFPLLFEANTNVVYSCLGFILLGKICEMAGGARLDELAERYVFKPLGLKTAAYKPSASVHTFASTEYCPVLKEHLCGVVHDENARFMGGISGNAGLFADIDDCAALAIMYARKGSGIVSEELFDKAVTNHTSHCEEGRGLGFVVKENEVWRFYGHTGFTGTSIFIDADTSQYIVFLTNRVHPTRENIRLVDFRGVVHACCVEEYRKGR